MSRYPAHLLRDVVSLDGMWDFSFLGDVQPEEVDLSGLRFESRMAVPGCFDATPLYAGKRGLTAYRTQVQRSGAGPHRLVFHSVHHWCRVFADGKLAREHAGGFTRFTADLPSGEPGWVEIIVLVDNRFAPGRSPLHLDHFDWYQYGGISRPVELERLGKVWIEGLRVVTERLAPPALRVTLDFRAVTPPGKVPLSFSLDGRPVFSETVNLSGTAGRMEQVLEVPGAALWSPQEPNLHLLEARLGPDDLRQRVGLRQVRVNGQQILINEQPLRLMGFNRHEAHPEFGHALPDQLIAADVQQLRDLGCNFVRGSHYPQDERFLELCDEAGLCVWSEAIGWQHTAQQLTNEAFLSGQVNHIEEMVAMAQNHPSVILWGILNESHSHDPVSRRGFARLLGRLRELDSSRPLTFASNHVFEDLCFDLVDIIAINTYPGWYHSEIENIPAYLDQVAEHLDAIGQGGKPLILSEIGAAAVPGWRDWQEDRWSEQYQARLLETVILHLFEGHERYAGLAIWQFCDMRAGGGVTHMMRRARAFNNKGVVDEYRRPKQAYETVKKLFHEFN